MRFYREGEKSSEVCDVCGKKVTTVMRREEHRPDGFAEPIPDLLVSACETCGTTLSLPAQSVLRVAAARKSARPATRPIAVRVSAALEDALGLAVAEIGGPAPLVGPGLLRYYLGLVVDSPDVAARVKDRAASSPVAQPGPGRLSVRVGEEQFERVSSVAEAAGIGNTGDLVRGAVALAVEDLGLTYRDPSGQLVTSKPDAAGRQRVATLRQMVRFFA